MADSKQFRARFYQMNAIFLGVVVTVLIFLNLTADRASRFKLDLP